MLDRRRAISLVAEVVDKTRKRYRAEIEEIYVKMEDGTATDEERKEYSAWLNHDRGLLEGCVEAMKVLNDAPEA